MRKNHKKKLVVLSKGLCAVLCTFVAEDTRGSEVTMETLLQEMINRDAPARWPVPGYTGKQASSWDRSQTGPDDPATWFNNNDYDQFIRIEETAGRKEYVIMEDPGPGAVIRIWKPLDIGNELPKQTIRFYLDGSLEPVIESDFTKLLSGTSIFEEPFSFIASDEKDAEQQYSLPKDYKQLGGDLYFPIPYGKSCKVTIEVHPKPGDAPHNVFFYIINYRSYQPGTTVKSFTLADYKASAAEVKHAAETLNKLDNVADGKEQRKEGTIEPGASLAMDLPSGANAVRTLEVQIDPDDAPQVLRSAVLEATFDGEAAIWCPIGEFFGCGARLNPVHDWSRSVGKDGKLTSRWVMPYGKSARVAIRNLGKTSLTVKIVASTSAWQWDDHSMHFHANWRSQYPLGTIPRSDWNYIQIQGQGVYVGDTLTVFSHAKGWYGEGDERIYIDGEKFPSHLGTGTEDYYGYAWGMAHHFDSPFISMPLRDGRGKQDWRGYTTTSRVRLLDGISFQSSLKLDMEVWAVENTTLGYAVGTFWYAKPGATSNRGPAPEEASAELPTLHSAPQSAFRDAIEFESMKVLAATPALPVETQQLAGLPGEWSGAAHLFVRATKPGEFVELVVAEDIDGPRRITLHATKSNDYGTIQFSVNGQPVAKPFDGFNASPQPSGAIDLGVFEPKDGRFVLRAEVAGNNPASKGHFFGLDCIVLAP